MAHYKDTTTSEGIVAAIQKAKDVLPEIRLSNAGLYHFLFDMLDDIEEFIKREGEEVAESIFDSIRFPCDMVFDDLQQKFFGPARP